MNHSNPQELNADHYIIAIGASAGGLEAIHEFFDNMPQSDHLSFVIIQHLSPDYKSLLVELIGRHTHMQVFEAGHEQEVRKNCVYVIPNDKLLAIKNGRLLLSEKNFDKAPNTAIDFFLHTLAQDQRSRAIAIILSGTGTDGSKGIQSIQEHGGMVLVQDPLTAKFDGMPNAAIATGVAELILAPELMPEEIFHYINERPFHLAVEGKPSENSLPEVLKLVERNCHQDFTNYKSPTILRRIGRRMGILGLINFNDYLELLRTSNEECKFLGKEFLIGVTKFFRDEAAFQIIREKVLPHIIASKKDGELIKIWVTACSTGEEAYSLAILIDDLLQKTGRSLDVKIFATDIDADAIETASKALYPSVSIAELDEDLKRRYFFNEGNNIQVQAFLRKQIVFARHNILKDPPFIKNDMATCRNMLIYMNNVLQRKVLSTLQFSLNTGGFLFLGPSETPASIKEHLDEINGKWKIFRKISNESGYDPERLPSTQTYRREIKYNTVSKEKAVAKELADDMRELLTTEYGYAAVYIDRNNEIKEAIGDFRKYLSLPDRLSSMNILKMVPPEVSVILNTAIRKAIKDNNKVAMHHVRMKSNEEEKSLNIFIRPSAKNELLLVVFGETRESYSQKIFTDFVQPQHPASVSYIAELEEELKETRGHLQMAIENLETANEELQSSNEELLSANEELQSGNEELQSLNEELHTVNAELQMRIKELVELNDDLENYFSSSEVAQVFVDRELRIRKFNPVAIRMINLIPGDVGRPIDHISTNFKEYANFLADIKTVQTNGTLLEREVNLMNGRVQLMRILPYIRKDKSRDGVVIAFIDISNIKELDNIVKSVFNASLSAIMAFNAVRNNKGKIIDLVWVASNHATDQLVMKGSQHYMGKTIKESLPQFIDNGLFDKCIAVIESGKPLHEEVFLKVPEETWFEVTATQMNDGIVVNLADINEKKKAEEKFKRNYQELIRTKENYRNLNLELEEKVKERTYELSQSEERFRLIASATNDAVWDWDLVNNQIWWSESYYNKFGFERNAQANTFNFKLNRIHPDDREKVKAEIDHAIQDGSHDLMVRYRIQKPDGSYASILDRGTVLFDQHGIPYRMVGAMMDVTEMDIAAEKVRIKNTELQTVIQEFKFVTDFMPQLVWSTLPDGYHDFYNKGWYDYTGLSYDQTKGEAWNNVVHPEDQERAWKVWRNCLQTGDPYEIEYRFKRYDGTYRWFLGRALPMRDESGKIIKWFGTCTDIHDQKMMNDLLEQKVIERTIELQKSNEELEESNHELLQFASVASHDLKEPLRKIHMFSNILKDRYFSTNKQDEDAAQYLSRIISASARMTRLINDLLSFTRLSVMSNFEKISLNQIVKEVMSDLELLIAEKQACFEIDNLPEIDAVSGHMRQVFQNIISNALKFSLDDVKPIIKIKSERVSGLHFINEADKAGEFCRITITDNGIGFDNQYADKIFTIFQRLHSREKYDGTGIGLAITKKIIDKHNGIITAKSKLGKGASFIFVLPLKQQKEVTEQIIEDSEEQMELDSI